MQAPPLPPTLDFPRIKILAAGNSGCGKSCLVKRYCEGRFVNKYIPTIGIDYGVKKVEVKPALIAQHRQTLKAAGHAGQHGASGTAASSLPAVRVNFWDVAGGAESLQIRNEFYAAAQGVLLVYDVRDAESFAALDAWLEELRTYSNTGGDAAATARRTSSHTTTSNTPAGRAVGDLDGSGPILYLLANKVDDVAVSPGESVRRVVSESDGRQWAQRNGCVAYYETSASSNLNVAVAMEGLFYDVMAKFM